MSDFIEYTEEEMSVFTDIMRKNRVHTESKSWSELTEIANAMNAYAKHVANGASTSDSGLHLQRVSFSEERAEVCDTCGTKLDQGTCWKGACEKNGYPF